MEKVIKTDLLAIALTDGVPECRLGISVTSDGIKISGRRYITNAASGANGFYDWLRGSGGNVVGIRYWIFDDNPVLLDKNFIQLVTESLPYTVYLNEKNCLEVIFDKTKKIIQEESDDQDFGFNAIFKSDDDRYLLAFDVANLDESQLEKISQRRSSG